MKLDPHHLEIKLNKKKKTNDFDKPPASYITLIQEAINKSPNGLTLNEIYESLKRDYVCFRKSKYDGWKNSVSFFLKFIRTFHQIS